MTRAGVDNPGCSLLLTFKAAWVRYDLSKVTDPGPRVGCDQSRLYRVFHSEPTLAASHLGPCSSSGLSELRKVPALDSTHSRISRLSPSALASQGLFGSGDPQARPGYRSSEPGQWAASGHRPGLTPSIGHS